MKSSRLNSIFILIISLIFMVSCNSSTPISGSLTPAPIRAAPTSTNTPVLATLSVLADISQNVAGNRLRVSALIPPGLDPHSFEPTPADAIRVAQSRVVVTNGAGFEVWLEELLQNADALPTGERIVIDASAGLISRSPQPGEFGEDSAGSTETDPHFWLDPIQAIAYVGNIRAGLATFDPQGAQVYAQNAADYTASLRELDAWIADQVKTIPPERRLLVTDHESFGYFADRYGFQIIGAIIPSVSSGSAPSAKQFASLVERIRSSRAPAIFLETGANSQLAEQLAQETGVELVTGLYTHSLTAADGEAPTYVEMMRFNTQKIVDALK